MPTAGWQVQGLRDVVGSAVVAEAIVQSQSWRMRSGTEGAVALGGPGFWWAWLRRRPILPSAGPDYCALAVTDDALVAVTLRGGWVRMTALSVIEHVPRTSIAAAGTYRRGLLAVLVVHLNTGARWVFVGERGYASRHFRQVVAALGF